MQKKRDYYNNNNIVNEYKLNRYIKTASIDFINHTINDKNYKQFFCKELNK